MTDISPQLHTAKRVDAKNQLSRAQLVDFTNGQSTTPHGQNEVGSKKTYPLEQEIMDMGKVDAEKKIRCLEAKEKTMGKGESKIENRIDSSKIDVDVESRCRKYDREIGRDTGAK